MSKKPAGIQSRTSNKGLTIRVQRKKKAAQQILSGSSSSRACKQKLSIRWAPLLLNMESLEAFWPSQDLESHSVSRFEGPIATSRNR
jgi:hypothetical protein